MVNERPDFRRVSGLTALTGTQATGTFAETFGLDADRRNAATNIGQSVLFS